jgi:23S rRNA (guanine2445-N2)-methyltransferase / 23S rRNA (guanine2069-N7)-methyltransferase
VEKLHEEASERAAAGLAKPPLWIRGYEADPRLIQPGRNNVERAGLSEWIKIYRAKSRPSSRVRTRTRKAW